MNTRLIRSIVAGFSAKEAFRLTMLPGGYVSGDTPLRKLEKLAEFCVHGPELPVILAKFKEMSAPEQSELIKKLTDIKEPGIELDFSTGASKVRSEGGDVKGRLQQYQTDFDSQDVNQEPYKKLLREALEEHFALQGSYKGHEKDLTETLRDPIQNHVDTGEGHVKDGELIKGTIAKLALLVTKFSPDEKLPRGTLSTLHDLADLKPKAYYAFVTNVLAGKDFTGEIDRANRLVERLRSTQGLTKEELAIHNRALVVKDFQDGYKWVTILKPNGDLSPNVDSAISYKVHGNCGVGRGTYYQLRKDNLVVLDASVNDEGYVDEARGKDNNLPSDEEIEETRPHAAWLFLHGFHGKPVKGTNMNHGGDTNYGMIQLAGMTKKDLETLVSHLNNNNTHSPYPDPSSYLPPSGQLGKHKDMMSRYKEDGSHSAEVSSKKDGVEFIQHLLSKHNMHVDRDENDIIETLTQYRKGKLSAEEAMSQIPIKQYPALLGEDGVKKYVTDSLIKKIIENPYYGQEDNAKDLINMRPDSPVWYGHIDKLAGYIYDAGVRHKVPEALYRQATDSICAHAAKGEKVYSGTVHFNKRLIKSKKFQEAIRDGLKTGTLSLDGLINILDHDGLVALVQEDPNFSSYILDSIRKKGWSSVDNLFHRIGADPNTGYRTSGIPLEDLTEALFEHIKTSGAHGLGIVDAPNFMLSRVLQDPAKLEEMKGSILEALSKSGLHSKIFRDEHLTISERANGDKPSAMADLLGGPEAGKAFASYMMEGGSHMANDKALDTLIKNQTVLLDPGAIASLPRVLFTCISSRNSDSFLSALKNPQIAKSMYQYLSSTDLHKTILMQNTFSGVSGAMRHILHQFQGAVASALLNYSKDYPLSTVLDGCRKLLYFGGSLDWIPGEHILTVLAEQINSGEVPLNGSIIASSADDKYLPKILRQEPVRDAIKKQLSKHVQSGELKGIPAWLLDGFLSDAEMDKLGESAPAEEEDPSTALPGKYLNQNVASLLRHPSFAKTLVPRIISEFKRITKLEDTTKDTQVSSISSHASFKSALDKYPELRNSFAGCLMQKRKVTSSDVNAIRGLLRDDASLASNPKLVEKFRKFISNPDMDDSWTQLFSRGFSDVPAWKEAIAEALSTGSVPMLKVFEPRTSDHIEVDEHGKAKNPDIEFISDKVNECKKYIAEKEPLKLMELGGSTLNGICASYPESVLKGITEGALHPHGVREVVKHLNEARRGTSSLLSNNELIKAATEKVLLPGSSDKDYGTDKIGALLNDMGWRDIPLFMGRACSLSPDFAKSLKDAASAGGIARIIPEDYPPARAWEFVSHLIRTPHLHSLVTAQIPKILDTVYAPGYRRARLDTSTMQDTIDELLKTPGTEKEIVDWIKKELPISAASGDYTWFGLLRDKPSLLAPIIPAIIQGIKDSLNTEDSDELPDTEMNDASDEKSRDPRILEAAANHYLMEDLVKLSPEIKALELRRTAKNIHTRDWRSMTRYPNDQILKDMAHDPAYHTVLFTFIKRSLGEHALHVPTSCLLAYVQHPENLTLLLEYISREGTSWLFNTRPDDKDRDALIHLLRRDKRFLPALAQCLNQPHKSYLGERVPSEIKHDLLKSGLVRSDSPFLTRHNYSVWAAKTIMRDAPLVPEREEDEEADAEYGNNENNPFDELDTNDPDTIEYLSQYSKEDLLEHMPKHIVYHLLAQFPALTHAVPQTKYAGKKASTLRVVLAYIQKVSDTQ